MQSQTSLNILQVVGLNLESCYIHIKLLKIQNKTNEPMYQVDGLIKENISSDFKAE